MSYSTILNSYIELDFKARAIAMAYRTRINSNILS